LQAQAPEPAKAMSPQAKAASTGTAADPLAGLLGGLGGGAGGAGEFDVFRR